MTERDDVASSSTTEISPANVKSSSKKRRPLRRPRGKRGGLKNRAKPLTIIASGNGAKTSRNNKRNVNDTRHAQAIAEFHTLEKRIAQAQTGQEKKALLARQDELGGLSAYQDASLFGGDPQRGGETGKWCAQALQAIHAQSSEGKVIKDDEKVRLLDVGSLSGTAYAKYSRWIDATSIDINPRSQHVLKYDFFDFPAPNHVDEQFNVVALSLVLNFLGDIGKRGQMLLHAHKYLKHSLQSGSSNGHLFLVLPLACVQNSRYLTHQHLRDILSAAGWGDVVRQDDSARLTRWLVRETSKTWNGKAFPKRELRKGTTLNNFCIVLR